MLLLFGSTILDFLYGFGVSSNNPKKSKLFLWLSIINNLGVLAIFKYYNFFIEQFIQLFEMIGVNLNLNFISIALPVGISFYTFHGMSYVFDIYNKKQEPVKNFIDYAVFVSFFPLLVAGPIERANHLLPQVQKRRTWNYVQFKSGIYLIIWGFFKKVVIADTLSNYVNYNFNQIDTHSSGALILSAIAFSFQIYGDFSGYSDIALGTAKTFGFELLSNFKFPYFSRDIAEFWRRWHISLSSWFRDYLYIPLGGSKSGKLKSVYNTCTIFIVSGFWHGASWNFIVWGAIHALGFIPLLLLGQNRKNIEIVAYNSMFPTLKDILKIITTFIFVSVAWVFFRANTITDAFLYFRTILNWGNSLMFFDDNFFRGLNIFYYIFILLSFDWVFRRNERDLQSSVKNKILFNFIIIFMLCFDIIYFNNSVSEFIYFQF